MTNKIRKVALVCSDILVRAKSAQQLIRLGLECHAYIDLRSFVQDIGYGHTFTNVVLIPDPHFSIQALGMLGENNARLGVFKHVYILCSSTEIRNEIVDMDKVTFVQDIEQIAQFCLADRHDQFQMSTAQKRRLPSFTIKNAALSQLLTTRERQVVCYIASGYSSKEIGRNLKISHRTVEVHRSRAFKKLNVRNGAEAALVLGQ